MEPSKYVPFRCICGGEMIKIVPDHYYYSCPACDLHYFILYVPFDVFDPFEKHLLKTNDPKMDYICSEVAAKRVLSRNPYLSVGPIRWMQSEGCTDIHTISKCLNFEMKFEPQTGYKLMYRRPFTTQITAAGKTEPKPQLLSEQQEVPLFKAYMNAILEPIIASVIPRNNWQLLMTKLYEGSDRFMDLYLSALHTIVIAGYTLDPSIDVHFLVHDHISGIPIEQQRPYMPVHFQKFEYAHTLADFRTIINFHMIGSKDSINSKILEYYREYP